MSESNVLMSTIYKNCFNTVSPDTILDFIQRARLLSYLVKKYTEYLLLVINIVFICYIFNELYAHIIYYL